MYTQLPQFHEYVRGTYTQCPDNSLSRSKLEALMAVIKSKFSAQEPPYPRGTKRRFDGATVSGPNKMARFEQMETGGIPCLLQILQLLDSKNQVSLAATSLARIGKNPLKQ